MICADSLLTIPRILWRVVCAFGLTTLSFSPTNLLYKVLLPALGKPMMLTNPALNDIPIQITEFCTRSHVLIFQNHLYAGDKTLRSNVVLIIQLSAAPRIEEAFYTRNQATGGRKMYFFLYVHLGGDYLNRDSPSLCRFSGLYLNL